MVKFAYNNIKNTNTGHILFELNYKYYSCIFYKKDLDLCSKLKTEEKLSFELQNLMATYQQNFYHA